MKIIQIVPAFDLAGAEIMCENLTYELRKRGHNVIVISMYDYHSAITDRLETAGVDVRYLGKKSGLDFSMIQKMKKIFTEEKADAVHTHLYCTKYAVPAAVLAGVKCRIHTVHNVAQKESGAAARKLNKFFFKYCHVVPVALSKLIQDSIVEAYSMGRERIPVIFNGINLFSCKPKTNYGICGNFKILNIGRFSEQKNHAGLLRAFRLFHAKHSDSELWLIGDGEKRSEAEAYVKDNGLENAVKFLGLQSDVYGYLHDADIFALPSHYEGIPMTLIEAMGTGLPIVATAVGGVPDMLNKENAQLVPVDVEEITKAFEHYYSDINARVLDGQKVRSASERFSAEEMAKGYEVLYSRAVM